MRIAGKGLNLDAPEVSFSFDNRSYRGRGGEPLAASLLANGIRLMGRSFKYHRPRGVLTAGPEEPNALMTVGEGARATPNVRATVQPVYDGMVAMSQNRWPSLANDIMGVNDWLSPFLGAGFYYKTFMWPKAFWEAVYEPIIRRAAGLGALSGEPNPDAYEKAFAFCDILIIGAGPAGLMAALTAGRSGADVILADEDEALGGRCLSEAEEIGGRSASDWAAGVAAELAEMPNVRVMTRTCVTGAYDGGVFGALERVGEPGQDRVQECFWRISATRSILASGAIERPIAFAGNDRPGIMTASAVRSYLHRFGVVAGSSVAVFGSTDEAHRTARDLLASGIRVTALVDAREGAECGLDVPFFAGGRVTGTKGRLGLSGIKVAQGSGERWIPATCLGMAGGWNPSIHLTCHMGGRPRWNAEKTAFLPMSGTVPGLTVAGAANGTFTTYGCLAEGDEVAKAALSELGSAIRSPGIPDAEHGFEAGEALWHVPGPGRAWLDFQNDVTVKDVKAAAAEGYTSVEHMKRYTTQGMATDQGKSSNVAALAVLAEATGGTIPETGTTTFRPPFTPVSIAAMGAGAEGAGFAPVRETTSHAYCNARGVPMVEAGLWFRPSYFPVPGETTWREACDREVRMVRQSVGVADVSTLGKIDIQGKDAAEFLNFVYTNGFAKLPVGKVRYGLMLREDGHVMDDGTCARLGPEHYVMTTTTAAAGQVMMHLDYVSQVLRPEWDVRFTSVTEHWAQFAVAGPRSLDVVDGLVDEGIGDLPFMGCCPVTVEGVAGRLFRISFSGERGYEIGVPARYGAALWRLLVAQAEGVGGGPYGMEALNVLRIEKGFLTHAELHGRTTAYDLGLQGMMSTKKDFIGRAAAGRDGLMDPGRERLVGLKPVEADGRILAGAHLFEKGAKPVRVSDQGYVTSAGYSPTLGHDLGLAFLRHGPERHGEVIRLVDEMRGVETLCEVTGSIAHDPDGGRMRG